MHHSIRHRLCDLRLRLTRSLHRVWMLFAITSLMPVLAAQTQAAATSQQALPTTAAQENAQKPAPAQQAASTQPPAPDWPINAQPKPATISWNKQELSIDAANSSLEQILTDVASATGASVDGVTKDERIFGIFGPAPARDVLAQLLQGTGYNVMMVGDGGQGLPRQIILTARSTSKAPQGGRATSDEADDDAVPEVQYDPPPQPQPQPPQQPPMRPGFNPAMPGAAGNPQQPQGQPQTNPPNP